MTAFYTPGSFELGPGDVCRDETHDDGCPCRLGGDPILRPVPTVEASEVWCYRCDAEATYVVRLTSDEVISLCRAHYLDATWRATSPSWRAS